jgi:hypothetical protein
VALGGLLFFRRDTYFTTGISYIIKRKVMIGNTSVKFLTKGTPISLNFKAKLSLKKKIKAHVGIMKKLIF